MIIWLENFFLKIAFQIAKVLAKTKITPRQITVARFIIAVPMSLYFFSKGNYLCNVIGLFFYMSLAIFDWVDGSLAKIKKLPLATKPLGVFIDHSSDRILMLIVLSSIFYAGMNSGEEKAWVVITILFFSTLFFLATILHEFDKVTGLEYQKYPELGKKLYKPAECFSLKDRFLWNCLYVSHSSIAKFCFTISYPLFLGIITNQLIPAFIFIVFMLGLRSAGIFSIMYCVLNIKKTDSVLIEALKDYVAKIQKQGLS